VCVCVLELATFVELVPLIVDSFCGLMIFQLLIPFYFVHML